MTIFSKIRSFIRFEQNLSIKQKTCLIGIVLIGSLLRFNDYSEFPIYGETADEWAWVWLGSSLIQTGQPTSWSYFSPYEDHVYKQLDHGAPMVRPALDHPPLFALYAGVTHSLVGSWEAAPSAKVTRLSMVILGVINLILFVAVTVRFFKRSPTVAVVASLLYATIPSIVFTSRLVVAENGLITLLLSALLIILANEKTTSKGMFLLVLISCAAVLVKISGLFIPISLIVYGCLKKEKKLWQAGIWGLLIGIITLVCYVSAFDFGLFLEVQSSQGGRDVGLATLANRLFLHPSIVRDIFVDGWLVVGLFSIAISSFIRDKEDNNHLIVSILAVMQLAFVTLTVGEQTFHGWYNFTLYPLLVLSSVQLLSYLIRNQQTVVIGLLWLFLLPVIRMSLVYTGMYYELSSHISRALVVIGFLPLAGSMLGKEKLIKPICILLGVLLVLAHILTIGFVNFEAYSIDHAFFNYP